MATIIHAKFHFNWLILTLIFGIWASESSPSPSQAWRTTEKAGPDRAKDVDIPAIYSCQTRVSFITSLKFSRDAKAEAVSRQKELFLVQVVLSL